MEGIYHDADLLGSKENQNSSIDRSADTSEPTSFVGSSINASMTSEDKIHLYAQMVRIRRFEERSFLTSRVTLGVFCTFTLGKRLWRLGLFRLW